MCEHLIQDHPCGISGHNQKSENGLNVYEKFLVILLKNFLTSIIVKNMRSDFCLRYLPSRLAGRRRSEERHLGTKRYKWYVDPLNEAMKPSPRAKVNGKAGP